MKRDLPSRGRSSASSSSDEGLSGADLQGRDFTEAKLEGADLSNARLSGACFDGANLSGADLRGADLTGVNFKGADLRFSDLRGTTGLTASRLARADTGGASLPKTVLDQLSLEGVDEHSRNARRLLWSTLLICAYSWLTIFQTTDTELLTNSRSSSLPIIGTELPIEGFYLAAPLLLLLLYTYLHVYLVGLWRRLVSFPAVFPDERPLEDHTYPWLLSSLLSQRSGTAEDRSRKSTRFRFWGGIVLVWGMVPVTLWLFWSRYLLVHNLVATVIHLGTLILTVVVGFKSFRLTRGILRWRETEGEKPVHRERSVQVAAVPLLGTVVITAVVFFVDPILVPTIPYLLRPHANLVDVALSTVPKEWRPGDDVSGIRLDGVDLRRATLTNAALGGAQLEGARFSGGHARRIELAGARLSNADLDHAYLVEADLRGADLRGSSLDASDLRGAVLDSADLSNASLRGADLRRASLNGAVLRAAQLQDARLDNAELLFADLTGAILDRAILFEADLRCVEAREAGFRRADLASADVSGATMIGSDFTSARLVYAVFERSDLTRVTFDSVHAVAAEFRGARLLRGNLRNAVLSGASLRGAILWGADLRGAVLVGTRLEKAQLRGANLEHADLQLSVATNADLRLATLDSVDLRGADLRKGTVGGASFRGARLNHTRLAGVREWERVSQAPPSLDHVVESLPGDFLGAKMEPSSIGVRRGDPFAGCIRLAESLGIRRASETPKLWMAGGAVPP